MPRPVLSCLLLLLQQLACPVQQHDKGSHIVRSARLQRLLHQRICGRLGRRA